MNDRFVYVESNSLCLFRGRVGCFGALRCGDNSEEQGDGDPGSYLNGVICCWPESMACGLSVLLFVEEILSSKMFKEAA